MEDGSINTTPPVLDAPVENSSSDQMPTWWSWGWSFATTIMFVWVWKIPIVILYFILSFIPFVNLIALIWFFIYGWVKWKEIMYTSDKYKNHDEKMWAIKTLESVWFFFFILFLIFLSIFLIIFLFWMWSLLNTYM